MKYFAQAVGYICVAAVVIFMIQCSRKDSEKGRCVTWRDGTITCSGAACAHCTPRAAP